MQEKRKTPYYRRESKLKRLATGVLLVTTLMLGGCLKELTGSNYDRYETRSLQTVQFGEIIEIEMVKVDGTESGVGSVAGAATGGIAATHIGGGRGRLLATIAGAVTGGVLGNLAERKMTETSALNITVRLESGGYVSVVQQAEGSSSFQIGDRVKVMTQGNRGSRVVRTGAH